MLQWQILVNNRYILQLVHWVELITVLIIVITSSDKIRQATLIRWVEIPIQAAIWAR